MAGSVEAAVKKQIAQLPEELWTSVEALVALNLAHQMDTQTASASAGKLLIEIMTRLAEDSGPAKPQGDPLDDLVARRAARRSTSQAG
jgi:hypothetical protein